MRAVSELERCPTPNPFNGSGCKRRGCPFCGRLWAFDWERVMRTNLEWYGSPVLMVAITPPGAEVLPWACRRLHVHSGTRGCQVDPQAADAWAEKARSVYWKQLREDCRVAVLRRHGVKPTILLRVWEPQKRGVPHLHVVLGVGTPAERIAAWAFIDELRARAGAHGFGFVQRKVHESAGAGAARYLVGYLLGRSKRKGTIRENISHPRMPRQLVWLTPRLSSVTRCNMRRMRLARWYLRALSGRASLLPALYGQIMVDVALAVTFLEGRPDRDDQEDGAGDDEPVSLDAWRRERHLFHMATLRTMRQLRLAQIAA